MGSLPLTLDPRVHMRSDDGALNFICFQISPKSSVSIDVLSDSGNEVSRRRLNRIADHMESCGDMGLRINLN